MRRLALVVLFASAALALLTFRMLDGAPSTDPLSATRDWAFAPMLAFAIVVSMGCLVAIASGAGGRRGR